MSITITYKEKTLGRRHFQPRAPPTSRSFPTVSKYIQVAEESHFYDKSNIYVFRQSAELKYTFGRS